MSAARGVVAALLLGAALVLAACNGAWTTAGTSSATTAATPAGSAQNAMPLPAPSVAGTPAFARVMSVDDGVSVARTGDIWAVLTDGAGLTPLAAGSGLSVVPNTGKVWDPA